MTRSDPKKQWLSAAECAERTGLTVRALRVYEREGLVSPARSPKGWRRYGPAELSRLNTVASLKALGLTLDQIRQVLTVSPPPLTQILDIQIEAWRARRESAEQALTRLLVARGHAALQALSLEELCELVKAIQTVESVRSHAMSSASSIFRRLLSEALSSQEEQVWRAWWAAHPADLAAMQKSADLTWQLFAEVEQLAGQQADPASPGGQELVRRHHLILTQHDTRDRALRLMLWNPSITAKFHGIWPKAFAQLAQPWNPAEGPPLLSRQGAIFFAAAVAASPATQACRALLQDVRKLLDLDRDAASCEADPVVQRLAAICQTHDLGRPYAHVQWTRFRTRLTAAASFKPAEEAAWAFLARALEHRGERRDPGLVELEKWMDTAAPAPPVPPALAGAQVPVIPLRDVVVYPGMALPLFVGRPKTLQAAQTALRGRRQVLLVTQRRPDIHDPGLEDLHPIGTVAEILEAMEMAGGMHRVFVKGLGRARLDLLHAGELLCADITALPEDSFGEDEQSEALKNAVIARFEQHAQKTGWPPQHEGLPGPPLAAIITSFRSLDAGRLADMIAAHTPLPLAQRQEVLELLDSRRRLAYVEEATRSLEPPA